MTPRDLLAKLATDPDDDCIFVLKPNEGLRAWVPPAATRSLMDGEMPLHVVRTLVAQHFLGNADEQLSHLVELSSRTVSRMMSPEAEVAAVRKSITLKASFTRMLRKLQINTRTDAILVLNREDNNQLYIPDGAVDLLDRGDADLHIVTAAALSEMLHDGIRYWPYWREALEDMIPGYVVDSGLEAAMQKARQTPPQEG